MLGNSLKKLISNEKGIALIGVVIVFIIVGAISIGTMVTSSRESLMVESNLRFNQSLYTAESAMNGISLSLRNINYWDDAVWSNKIGNSVMTVGGTAVLDNITIDMVNFISDVTVTGTASGAEPRQIMVQIYGTLSPFDHAACSCNGIAFSGSAIADSYDSDLGPYGGANIGCEGDIGSNGGMDLKNSDVCGDIEAGGDLIGESGSSVSGMAELGGSAAAMIGTVAGGLTDGISPPPEPCKCNLDVATPLAAAAAVNDNGSIDPAYLSGTSFDIAGSNNIVLGCGDYYFTSFEIRGNATVTADPTCTDANPIRIYLAGNTGPFDFGGNGIINTPERSTNLRIYSLTTADINFSGSNEFAGLVYTPNANVNVNVGGGGFYGAYVAANSAVGGSVNLHYDVQMANIIDLQDGFARLTRLLWQENPL
jgi:hypothetical protein